jgi:hypothetical protein
MPEPPPVMRMVLPVVCIESLLALVRGDIIHILSRGK